MKHTKPSTIIIGAVIMISTGMFAAGCKSSQSVESATQTDASQNATDSGKTEASSPKPGVNEDGIAIFAPDKIADLDIGREYGKTERISYYSTIAEKKKNAVVLLPPGYNPDKKYPVMYLLHGIFGDENSMLGNPSNGNRFTVWNMMISGEAKEMIVVLPFMYTSKTQAQCTAIDEKNVEAYDIFVEDLADCLMPYMAENYSVLEGRENTAIIGFSMGGRESLAIGLLRPDLFGYVCAIAPAPGLVPGKDFAMYHKGQFAEDELKFKDGDPLPKLLMLCAGDRDSVVGTFPISYHTLFEKNGVEHLWWIIPGSDHGDPAITSGIYNFCQRIFR